MNPLIGFDIKPTSSPLGFEYGPGVFGPACELRGLDSIRPSLRDPHCSGPDPVYAIAMDVGKEEWRADLLARNLLFGAVTYASGHSGDEPVRSQGHIHAVSASCGRSTPELYEIWSGWAVILMQEHVCDDPGRCFAVAAAPGEIVIVPPGWAHATISADAGQTLTSGHGACATSDSIIGQCERMSGWLGSPAFRAATWNGWQIQSIQSAANWL